MLFINDKKYTALDVATIWLEKHLGIVDYIEKCVPIWLEEWKNTNHAEFAYNKDDDFQKAIQKKAQDYYITKAKNEIENKFISTLRKKKQKRLKEYKSSFRYKEDYTKVLKQNIDYQLLLSEEYEKSSKFKELYDIEIKARQKSFSKRVLKIVKKEMEERMIQEAFSFIETIDLKTRIEKLNLDELVMEEIKKELTTKRIYYHDCFLYPTTNSLLSVSDKYVNYLLNIGLPRFMKGHLTFDSYIEKRIERRSPILRNVADKIPNFSKRFCSYIEEHFHVAEEFHNKLKETITKEWFIECVLQNPIYHQWLLKEIEQDEADQFVTQCILEKIPENYIDLFPMARKINRHFVLHIGPTNSGKTYEAMQAFREAKTAIYLAPLRLLAYEVYEESNSLDCPCNMITGEEDIIVENATHTACTIEMANFDVHYDVCVIDEAQLLSDEERGGAWTAAILGIQADIIHICSANSASEILLNLIAYCDDSYEIIQHERFVPLVLDENEFSFPLTVKKHDALIVFSKKNVLFVAAELQKNNWKVSIIYGALPYESRIKEVERFINEETDVIVSTDAIGMGMNLPIERIVFLETEKFDGKVKRQLTEQEIKQIAGRAGRKGIYEIGYYTSEYQKEMIQNNIFIESTVLEKAYIGFPESLVSINEKLSCILQKWSEMPAKDIFVKQNVSTEISLALMLEKQSDNKQLIYQFIKIPFDVKNQLLNEIWYQLFQIQERGIMMESYYEKFLFSDFECNEFDLDILECEYKKCDLLYNYCRTFGFYKEKEKILKHKKHVSTLISNKLGEQKLTARTCKHCRKILPWNYPYGYCDECYHKLYCNYDFYDYYDYY